jgi:hypothetical protein
MERLITPANYSQEVLIDTLQGSGLAVDLILPNEVELVRVDPDSALECIDGRTGKLKKRKKFGYRVPGGSDFLQMTKYGGNFVGFNEGASATIAAGLRPGTHNNCAAYGLWETGELEQATFPLEITEQVLAKYHLSRGEFIRRWVRRYQGKHFDLESLGHHEEERFVINPFLGLTVRPNSEEFVYDHAVSKLLNIPPQSAVAVVVEIGKKLAQHINRVKLLKAA